jgi:uncharacterized protein (TIGR02145 family)
MKNNRIGPFLIILISFLTILLSSCDKDEATPVFETGTLTDIDGNVYKTVKIGTKWWMAENLKVQRYSNGDSISYVPQNIPDSVWSNNNTGAYCYFDEIYGFLYNYYSISNSGGLAPEGWHIPSDDEWNELERFLGMSNAEVEEINWRGSDQGNKLKIVGGDTRYWATSSDQYEIFGTNESGFTALGGACRIFNGEWGHITHTGFWWTSSSLNEDEAWYRSLDYNKANVFRYYGSKNYGFSVRCVKD